MTTISDIQDYFEALSEKHVDLLHTIDGRRAFARLQTDEHINQIKKKATPNIVVMSTVNGQRIGDVDDQQMRWGLSIIFAARAITSGSAAVAIDAANDKSAAIMFDFIARMQFDMNEECPMQWLEIEKVSWDDIEGPWLDNYYGWLLFVPFKTDMPAFDPEKWTDKNEEV